MKPRILFAAIVIIASACATQPVAVQENNKPWLQALITSLQQQPVANPPASITRYTYQSATVYYLSARCCDIRSKLYDADGVVICEPDGGIDGRGDRKCEDFIATRTDEKLVWKDSRS